MKVEGLNRVKEERALSSKHIHESLSEIISTYCNLMRENLVQDTQKVKATFEEMEGEQTLEEFIAVRIDESIEKAKGIKKSKNPEKTPLEWMIEDMISSYLEANSTNKELSDKLVYLKVRVAKGHRGL